MNSKPPRERVVLTPSTSAWLAPHTESNMSYETQSDKSVEQEQNAQLTDFAPARENLEQPDHGHFDAATTPADIAELPATYAAMVYDTHPEYERVIAALETIADGLEPDEVTISQWGYETTIRIGYGTVDESNGQYDADGSVLNSLHRAADNDRTFAFGDERTVEIEFGEVDGEVGQ